MRAKQTNSNNNNCSQVNQVTRQQVKLISDAPYGSGRGADQLKQQQQQ